MTFLKDFFKTFIIIFIGGIFSDMLIMHKSFNDSFNSSLGIFTILFIVSISALIVFLVKKRK